MRRDDAALWAVSGGFVHVSTQLPLPAVRPLKTVRVLHSLQQCISVTSDLS